MFRNTCVVDLEEYLALRSKVEKLERERKEVFRIAKYYNDEPRLYVNVELYADTIRAQLTESVFDGKYVLPDNISEWTRSLDVFNLVVEEDEEVEEDE